MTEGKPSAEIPSAGTPRKMTMRDFDFASLSPLKLLKPEEIRALCEREGLSRAIFAMHFNISEKLVADWECGRKKPRGAAIRLLTVLEKNGLQIFT